jgi:hypothetical protein
LKRRSRPLRDGCRQRKDGKHFDKRFARKFIRKPFPDNSAQEVRDFRRNDVNVALADRIDDRRLAPIQ